jgi:transcriptional regulator of acetoin/glycerol metabolism
MHTVALVNSSARLIEKCLFLRRHRADAMLRFHHRPEFVDLLHDGAMAVSCDGTIVATDMTGLRLLGAKEHKDLVGRSIADIFDATFDELLATAFPSLAASENHCDLRYRCTPLQSYEELIMGKGMDRKKETKKKAAKTPEEKRAAKKEKKEARR